MTAQELLERELRLRGYQYNSIKTYVSCLNTILSKLGENPSLDSIKDFLSRNLIKIVAAKGNRDRYVPLPGELLELLRAYFKAYHPAAPYLFNGQDGAVQYSQRSIGEFIKHYAKKAGIHKRIHAHKFRHSYATHLVEQGTDISLIQKSLGHASQKTTLIYAQISQATISRIPSPLNQISI